MAYDALTVLQTLTTKTANFSGSAVDLKSGTPMRGLDARVVVTSYSSGTAGTTIYFFIEHSNDGSTWHPLAYSEPLTTTTSAQSAVLHIPFETRRRYVRLSVSFAGGASPTATYFGDLGVAKP